MHCLTKIKFGNITNLADARFAAAAGVDYLGFCFDTKNLNYIPPIKAKEITDWITGSNIVAEFGDQSIDEINTISELLSSDVIELNNHILPDELTQLDKAIIKKIDVNGFSMDGLKKEMEAYKNFAELFHMYSSSDNEFSDRETMIELCSQYKIIWGFHINAGNAVNIISTFKPYAVNISGGMEEKTGIRDFDELNELLEKIQVSENY